MGTRAKNWASANTPSAEVIAYGKHMSFWEHPEVFNKALDEFLAKIK
jgi:non-heme chloroperoxidase